MRTLFTAILLALGASGIAVPADAQTARAPRISPSQLEPHGPGPFGRKAACAAGAGDNCGSNPPRYQLTSEMCGWLFSTSQSRNAGGSTDVSTRGIDYVLPSVAEMYAKGYLPGGLQPSSGFNNRQANCTFLFVMGAPGPENYLRISIAGAQGDDKLTPFAQGAYDIFNGSLVWPYRTPGTLALTWNGFSWLILYASPAIIEHMGQGQLAASGQGRLFLVTQDPSWWTVGTMVGQLAFCPLNGRGLVANANGGTQLSLIPANCAFRAATSGAATEYIGFRNLASGLINGLQQGAAYPAGTAPNGEAYPAGNYIVLNTVVNTYTTGNTIEVHNVPSNLGSNAEGKWIGKVIDANRIELHQRVMSHDERTKASVGPPSSFVAGDSLASATGYPGWNSAILTSVSFTSGRYTNLSNGVDAANLASADTIVGLARRATGVGYQDTPANRFVSSWYNPMDKRCSSGLTANRSQTGTAYVEINSEIRCNFVNLSRASSTAMALGDQGAGLRFTLTATVANSVAGAGCRLGVGFDGITTIEESVGMTSATAGAKQTLTVSGYKAGLTENNHYITAAVQAITNGASSGQCTVDGDARLALDLRQ